MAGNRAWTLMACTMFATIAIPFIPSGCEENTILHFAGPTSAGKTSGAAGAASIWGPPSRYVLDWRATSNALESVAQSRTHTGLILDEIKALQPHEVALVAYMLASGTGKKRSRPDGSMRPTRAWETKAISTGEKKLVDHAKSSTSKRDQHLDPGTASRIIDLEMPMVEDQHGVATSREFVQEFAVAFRQNYGHAGPTFTTWLAENQDEARRRLAEYVACFRAEMVAESILPPKATAQAERIAGQFGAIAAAGALAADILGLPWNARAMNDVVLTPAEMAFDAAFAGLREWIRLNGGTTVAGTLEAVEDLVSFVIMNQHRSVDSPSFQVGEETPAGDGTRSPLSLLGWFVYSRGILQSVAVLPQALDEAGWLPDRVSRVMRHLRDEGELMCKENELRTPHRSHLGLPVRVYKIRGSFLRSRLETDSANPPPDPDDPRTMA